MFQSWYGRLGLIGCSSHSGRRTSAVPPTWSKAKSDVKNVNLTSAFKQNNNLLEEQLNTMNIEKTQLESKFQGLEQSINDQLMKQKKLEDALSLEKSQSTKQTTPEVIVFKPDQNNCCFCSCGNRGFEESLQNY